MAPPLRVTARCRPVVPQPAGRPRAARAGAGAAIARLGTVLALLAWLAGCATPVLQSRGEQRTSPRLEADRVIAADGAVLPLGVWLPEGAPRAVVLALHGFNDYHQAFAGVGPFLAARGIATYAYDQRGFGATAQRGIWPGTDVLVDDARTVTALLRAAHPDRPLVLLGESMGGAVVMSLLADTPAAADGAALVAPAVWGRATMNRLQRIGLWLLAHTVPGTRLSGRGLGITASDNTPILRALGRDPLVLKDARVDTLWGLTNLMDRALAAAPGLTTPALILYGARDEIIPRRPTCRMLAVLPATSRVAIYPDGYHMLTRDLGAPVVLEDLTVWLADPAASLPSGFEATGRPPLCG